MKLIQEKVGARQKSRLARALGNSSGLLVLGYIALLLMPVLLAAMQGLPARSFWADLSSALALCALAGLLAEFFLSGRFRFVSNCFGVDTTMRVHQLIARTLAMFLVAHPFLYAGHGPTWPMPWDTTRQFSLDFGLVSVLTGLTAWLALVTMVLFGIFREHWPGRYESWRRIHGVGALIVAVFGTIHVLEAGRYSQDATLAAFWVVFVALAVLSLGWVYVVKPLDQSRNPYVLRSVTKIANRTWELNLSPKRGTSLGFDPGQFVWLNVGHSPFSLCENPFSIASSPTSADVSFVIKEVGDFTRGIGDLQPGTRAYVDGPYGNLTLNRRDAPAVAFYAGGVGVAPILSILRDLRDKADTRPFVLFYGNRTRDQIVYANELASLPDRLNLRVEYILSEPEVDWTGRTGFIDARLIDETFASESLVEWTHIVCGPLGMIESIEVALRARGVPPHQIISESFYYD